MSRLGLSRLEVIKIGLFLLAVLAIMFLPRIVSDFRAQQFAYVGIYLIALLGLQVLKGFTGQISLGHGAFMAIGGYTTAILMSNSAPPLELFGHQFTNDVRDIWTIPLAGLVAGIVGFLFGFPALRLTGLYLALATFAVAVATPAIIRKFEEFTAAAPGSTSSRSTPSPVRPRRRIRSPSRLSASRSTCSDSRSRASTSGSTT